MTFEIKVSSRPDRPPLKLKVSELEDKAATVREFCKTYKIGGEREEVIRTEVIKYFESRAKIIQGVRGPQQVNSDVGSRGFETNNSSRPRFKLY